MKNIELNMNKHIEESIQARKLQKQQASPVGSEECKGTERAPTPQKDKKKQKKIAKERISKMEVIVEERKSARNSFAFQEEDKSAPEQRPELDSRLTEETLLQKRRLEEQQRLVRE